MKKTNGIIIENDKFCLRLNNNCVAESLICKENGEECLAKGNEMALFSLTEERPYNNEIKLAYPNKKTTFQANRVRREENKLIVGFELLKFEAIIEIIEDCDYIAFRLADFIGLKEHFDYLCLTPPPVLEFRLIQLPVLNRERYGDWLNVVWDDKVVINVLATSPTARIDSEDRTNYRIMCADAIRDIELKGCAAALVVSTPEKFLDVVDKIEEDFDLPRGVKSRRSEYLNKTIYWAPRINPDNIDMHLAYAKAGGFEMMQIHITSIFKGNWSYLGNFDYEDEYPEGPESLKAMLDKIKKAGIIPGLHTMHPHIGINSHYVAPVADHRLSIKKYFTLSKPLGLDDTTIYVEQNPVGAPTCDKCRVLKFDGELIEYEGFSTEYPYCFTGCKRGLYGTDVIPHSIGIIGGVLDISEYSAVTVHIDQSTSLQDEIADKIAEVYNMGFKFIYFDGSEATQAPFEYHIPNAQYRVYKKFEEKPLFCIGAAKAHFSWHMLSGGNAFDTFTTEVFKEKLVEHPFEEFSRMADDFTKVNFGWWEFRMDTQPDTLEYGCALATACDCPATMMVWDDTLAENQRREDILEVMHRWKEVRNKHWLTDEQKEQLKNVEQEHTLLLNEENEYELVPYDLIKQGANGNSALRAYAFERKGRSYVTFWHASGSAKLVLPINECDVVVEKTLGGEKIPVQQDGDLLTVPLSDKIYLSTKLSKEQLTEIFVKAQVID